MYFPVSSVGYWTYGHNIADNILDSVSRGPEQTVVSILIILHLMLGFIIVVNPFCQEIEHLLNIPTGGCIITASSIKRIQDNPEQAV